MTNLETGDNNPTPEQLADFLAEMVALKEREPFYFPAEIKAEDFGPKEWQIWQN